MTHIDGVLLAALVVVDDIMAVVVEDDAVLQHLRHTGTLVLVGSLQHLNAALGIGSHATGEEVTAGTKAEFGRTERILHSAVRARLADEATGTGGAVLTLRQTVDTVVEQNHVQVDVTTHGVDEVVAANSQTVAIARYLPDTELGVHHLGTCSDSGSTTVNGLHGIGIDVIRQAAAATNA